MRRWIVAGLGLGLASGVLAAAGGREASMDLRLAIGTDRSVYGPGDSLAVVLTLTNVGADPVLLRFATGQRFDVELQDSAGRSVWRWAEGRMFTHMLGQVRVPAGDSVAYQAAAPAPAAPGRYVVVGRIPAMDRVLEGRAEITVRP
jgi:hypothetical protein